MKNLLKKTFYVFCILFDAIKSSSRGHILMYHSFDLPEVFFNVSFDNFKKQINYLHKVNYKIVSLKDFLQRKQDGLSLKKYIALTCDDGYQDFITIARYANDQKIPITLFWPTGMLKDIISLSDGRQYPILSKKQLDELLQQCPNVFLGSHGVTHGEFTMLPDKDLAFELNQSLGDILNFSNNIPVIAYPRGKYNQAVISVSKEAGYIAGCTVREGGVAINTPNFELPRLSIDQKINLLAFRAKLTSFYDFYNKIK